MGALIFAPHGAAQADEAYMPHGMPITIHIDGEYLPCDVAPMVKNNRTLMPMRAAGEALGATVDWNPTQKTITLSKDSDVVKFVLNSSTYYVNGTAHHADIAPQIVQNRTLIPLRAFAEALDTRVDWNQYLLDVSISTTGEPATLPQIPIDTINEAGRWVQKYYTSNTDDIFGNWTRRENLYETWCTDYEFYYKLPTGYQNITISIEEHSSLPQPVIIIIKNDTWQTANGYRRNSFQNILYYKGPARGWAGNTELDYQIHEQNLVNTGSQTYDLVTGLPNPYQPRYDIYTRF